MTPRQIQTEFVKAMIRSAPIDLRLDNVHQVGDQTPDTHFFMIGCLDCGDKWLRVVFEHGQGSEWPMAARKKLEQHIEHFHVSGGST
jgi:hypothetical protein